MDFTREEQYPVFASSSDFFSQILNGAGLPPSSGSSGRTVKSLDASSSLVTGFSHSALSTNSLESFLQATVPPSALQLFSKPYGANSVDEQLPFNTLDNFSLATSVELMDDICGSSSADAASDSENHWTPAELPCLSASVPGFRRHREICLVEAPSESSSSGMHSSGPSSQLDPEKLAQNLSYTWSKPLKLESNRKEDAKPKRKGGYGRPKIVNPAQVYKYCICGFPALNPSQYRRHWRYQCDQGPKVIPTCQDCGDTFSRPDSLYRHRRSDTACPVKRLP